MNFFDQTVRARVYKCQKNLSGCGWQGSKTDFIYAGRNSGLRVCPVCGKPVKRADRGMKQEWTGLETEA